MRRRLIVVKRACKRAHAPIRVRKGNGTLVCLQCLRMQRRHQNMLSRCYDKSHPAYPNYGGRGITVCDRWRHSFSNWYSDIGYQLDGTGLTIDRKDNDGAYTPDNCKAATASEQNRNQRRSVRYTFDGVTMNQTDWNQRYSIPKGQISHRLRDGETLEYAMFSTRVTKTGKAVFITKSKITLSLKQWCSKLRFSLRTVEDRIYKFGWSYTQALGFTPRNGKLRPPRVKT